MHPMTLKYTSAPIARADLSGFDAIISTPRTDLDGEVVVPLGLTNRDEYLANPLVYWAHEWAFDPAAEPIGKATRLDLFADRIESSAVYAPTPKAQNVRALVSGGFVRKTSIGFDPGRVEDVKGVPHHMEWSLREWSVVPMPSNVEATIIGVKSALHWMADQMGDDAKVDTAKLVEIAERDRLVIEPSAVNAVAIGDGKRRLLIMARRKVLRAAWSTQYVNDLPDSAFACIDSSGRHYPHHDASGAVDAAHLRNALARIGDPSNTQCGKGHLMAHARAMGIGG